jgi:hypothetical protein
MGLIRFITRVFIDVFGITHPTPEEEQRAAWFICGSLIVIVAGLASLFVVLFMHAHR